jgi:hypothetical protein
MKEERKGTRGASKRAARARRVPEANSRVSSNGLNREHHTSRQETPQLRDLLEGAAVRIAEPTTSVFSAISVPIPLLFAAVDVFYSCTVAKHAM